MLDLLLHGTPTGAVKGHAGLSVRPKGAGQSDFRPKGAGQSDLSAQIRASGTHLAHFWGQGWKMLKLELLELIWATSEARAGKCSNQGFWSSFGALLGPRPENV